MEYICFILFMMFVSWIAEIAIDASFMDKVLEEEHEMKEKMSNIEKYISKYMPNTLNVAKNYKSIISHINKIAPFNYNDCLKITKIDMQEVGWVMLCEERGILANFIYDLIIDEIDTLIQHLLLINGKNKFSFNNAFAAQNGMRQLAPNKTLRELINRKHNEKFTNKRFLFDIVNDTIYWSETSLGHDVFSKINKRYSTMLAFIFNEYCTEINVQYDKTILTDINFKQFL